MDIQAQNIKCGGCVANIKNHLGDMDGVELVEVTIDTGLVHIEGNNINESAIRQKLEEIGYPPAND